MNMLSSTKNMQAIAYDKLKEMIISLKLQPGEKIVLKDLIRTLGIGRTPIREALIKCKEQGLVKVIPQSGTYISKIDLKKAEDAMFVRKLVETKIVQLAITKKDDTLKSKLTGILAIARIQENQQDRLNFFHFDNKFHKAFYTATDKEDVWTWLQSINVELERFRYLRLSVGELHWSTIIKQHELLLNAVGSHDTNLGADEISKHLSLMINEEKNLLTAFPNYFENSSN